MNHVYDSEYGYVIYAWDVVNEYLHADDTNWIAVYGKQGNTPSFVKLAFEIADDVLRDYGIRDKVTLIFNDFNTYGDYPGAPNPHNLIAIVKYINSEKKICNGIGMQAHLRAYDPSVEQFKKAAKAFVDAGLEVQITELDAGSDNSSKQAQYYYDLMSALLELKKAGGNITGITYWGLSDSNSWRGGDSPLLFSTPDKPKDAYYKVIQAYLDAGYSIE